jgi:UDP-GlcNAc:undecaprenyl-phosphate/decaprenyl-phosphate GlcNAc-1-phosphate transferase
VTFIAIAGQTVPLLLIALAAAATISFLLTPLVRRLAIRFDAVDRPGHRRVNTAPVPRGGGVAVATSFIVVTVGLLVVNAIAPFMTIPSSIEAPDLLGLLLGGALAAAFGVVDDALDLRARWQFGGQLGLALLAIAAGFVVDFINNPFGSGIVHFSGPFAVGFTVLWIAGMINSINFIDGLDGLSSGIGLIAAVTLGVISLSTQVSQPFVAVLCFALAGSLLGFLRWNFHPASIFVGTSGVMFLGYTLGVLSILGTAKVAVAMLVLGVPIIDAFWIIVRRLAQGRSPFSPDRGHLHHRLLDIGLSHRQTVLLIYGICAALAALAMLLSGATQLYAFVGVFVASGFILFILAHGGLTRDEGDFRS